MIFHFGLLTHKPQKKQKVNFLINLSKANPINVRVISIKQIILFSQSRVGEQVLSEYFLTYCTSAKIKMIKL